VTLRLRAELNHPSGDVLAVTTGFNEVLRVDPDIQHVDLEVDRGENSIPGPAATSSTRSIRTRVTRDSTYFTLQNADTDPPPCTPIGA
jgi:hypothetical protein